MSRPIYSPGRIVPSTDHVGRIRPSALATRSVVRRCSLPYRAVVMLALTLALLASAALPTAPPVLVEAAPVNATVDLVSRPLATGTLALAAPSASTTYGTVTAYALNVRSGPGTAYRVLTTVPRGTRAALMGRSGFWYNVRFASGLAGWVYSAYFSLGSTVQPAASTGTGVAVARRTMVPNGTYISGWGAWRHSGSHQGEDIAAPYGSAIYSPARLTVYSTNWNSLGGWTVYARDAKGRYWYFAHMRSRSPVAAGTTVYKGQIIGYVGTTGDAVGTTPHLHYQVTWPGGTWGNPVYVLQYYPDVP